MSERPDRLLQLLLRMPSAPSLSVLAYHRVLPKPDPLRPGEPTAAEFERRMRWVKANFTVLPLPEAVSALRDGRLPRRAISITFDDGYADNHELALPVLRALGLPATFFIATAYLDGGCMFNDVVIEAIRQARGRVLDFDDLGLGAYALGALDDRRRAIDRILARLRYFDPERRDDAASRIAERTAACLPAGLMMTSRQVRELHAAGMTLGAHTERHPMLTRVSLQRARAEMAGGRARLEEITAVPVTLFAYPNGKPLIDYGPEHVRLAREAGFAAAFTTSHGAARPGDDLFQIPRFTPWDRADWRFGLRLAGNRRAARYARA